MSALDAQTALCQTLSGELLEPVRGPQAPRLTRFALRVPALFGQGTLQSNVLLGQSELATQSELETQSVDFRQILLVDAEWYYIAQPWKDDPEHTVVAIAPRTRSLASVLAEVRDCIAP